MNSTDLPEKQAEALRDQVASRLRWLNRLCERMQRTGFPPDDPLYFAALRARGAVQDLMSAAHLASCKHGVGR